MESYGIQTSDVDGGSVCDNVDNDGEGDNDKKDDIYMDLDSDNEDDYSIDRDDDSGGVDDSTSDLLSGDAHLHSR